MRTTIQADYLADGVIYPRYWADGSWMSESVRAMAFRRPLEAEAELKRLEAQTHRPKREDGTWVYTNLRVVTEG